MTFLKREEGIEGEDEDEEVGVKTDLVPMLCRSGRRQFRQVQSAREGTLIGTKPLFKMSARFIGIPPPHRASETHFALSHFLCPHPHHSVVCVSASVIALSTALHNLSHYPAIAGVY